MGVLSTYGELKSSLTDYTGRGGDTTFVANLPLFVRRAHDVLMRDLRIPLLQASADVTIDAERVAVPADFRAAARFFIDADFDSVLTPATLEDRVRTALGYAAGRPRVFSIEGSYFAFGPVPDGTYAGKLLYYRALTFFASDSATNDLLTRHPWAYFYGALAEWARFDRDDEALAIYEPMFRAEIEAINVGETLDSYAGGTMQPARPGAVV